jgi:hypothetical protein
VPERQLESSRCLRSILISASLKTYRVYCYDDARNAVTADFITASDDQDAIARVEAAGFGSKCEIWDGKRLVAQLEVERRTG